MSKKLMAVLVLIGASVVAIPAQAINEYWTGALLGGGAVYIFDRLSSRPQAAYGANTNHGNGISYQRPIAGRQPATIWCPPNTVSYDYRTNVCHGPAVVAGARQATPAVRPASTGARPAPAVDVAAGDAVVYNGQSCVRRNGTAGREGTLNGNPGCFKF